MICSKCCSDSVEWKGPLVNLTHTECGRCGAINCQVVYVEKQEEDEEEEDGKERQTLEQSTTQKWNCENFGVWPSEVDD